MAFNILDSNVTYESLIDSAASSLYNVLSTSSVGTGIYRDNTSTFTIGTGHSGAKNLVTLRVPENRTETYTAPSRNKIVSDIKSFMNSVGVPITKTIPTSDGIISFFFALNFFVEKSVIKRAIAASNNSTPTYHLHYSPPKPNSYIKIPHEYLEKTTVTTEKINNIYTQLQNTSLLSDNVRTTTLASGVHTSSSSSSSCSSSCSSSSFIVYFNLN